MSYIWKVQYEKSLGSDPKVWEEQSSDVVDTKEEAQVLAEAISNSDRDGTRNIKILWAHKPRLHCDNCGYEEESE
jgi:hypothetical protein